MFDQPPPVISSASRPLELTSPVTPIPGDEHAGPPRGVGLCLSGGGYRAMLFHLGSLTRLNELGCLPRLDRISSVSGGSITAGVLALGWEQLQFDGRGVATNFARVVAEPLRRLARHTIDAGAVLGGTLLPGSVSDRVIAAYRRHLFGDATLQSLPDRGPRFIFNATNVQSGALWRFSRAYMADWRVGMVERPRVPLAVAVAASSAFPPFLSPVELELDPQEFEPNSGDGLQQVPFTSQVVLTDGGVYDNLGLETVWKRCETVLVSDGGGQLEAEASPRRDWPQHSYRVFALVDSQVRALRKRQLIGAFVRGVRRGAYWGIRTDIKDYRLNDAPDFPHEQTLALARTPTRLKALSEELQQAIVDWGHAVCDAAMRKHMPGLAAAHEAREPAP